jgi:RNA polymerase sigma factor (sigma-70 family)
VTQLSEKELEELVARHGAALVLYARQWCIAPDDALQESLLELIQAATAPRDVVAWMFAVVRFKAMNLARSEHRRSEHQRRAAEERDPWFTHDQGSALEVGEVERALEQLTALGREIVVARIWGDLSFEQISELTGKPSSTVHRHFRQAMSQLKQMATWSHHASAIDRNQFHRDRLRLKP